MPGPSLSVLRLTRLVQVEYYKKGQPEAFKKVLQRFEKYKDESSAALPLPPLAAHFRLVFALSTLFEFLALASEIVDTPHTLSRRVRILCSDVRVIGLFFE